MALETSWEKPAPVRVVAAAVSGYVSRLGAIWVEGQIAELTRRPQLNRVFLTLRDPLAEVSIQVTAPRAVIDAMATPITEGARVIVLGKFDYYVARGTLSLQAYELRPVGMGELLARIEQRRRLLAAEGLFDPARKRPLPFLPRLVGLVVGRDSAAERDVVDNASRRWPGVRFRLEHARVQGHEAARQVIEAIEILDRDPEVDVIVVARGGGALEDLLPFSDEGLIRAVAACTTPVVSAIGHEEDQPLLDLVADLRASTPTDAAKRIVPDHRDEFAKIVGLRDHARYVLGHTLDREHRGLDSVRARPVLAHPSRLFDGAAAAVGALRDRCRRALAHHLARADDDLAHRLAAVRSLSPLATLARGYAVVQDLDGHPLTDPRKVATGDRVTARLAHGRLALTVDDATPDATLGRTADDADSTPPTRNP